MKTEAEVRSSGTQPVLCVVRYSETGVEEATAEHEVLIDAEQLQVHGEDLLYEMLDELYQEQGRTLLSLECRPLTLH